MKLIVGLGNPDKMYEKTYHNVGFMVLDKLKEKLGEDFTKSGYDAKYFKTIIGGETVFVAKPQTYMNLSGESIIAFKNFYKIEDENIIVIYDDIDLEPGTIRIRKKGGAGTHNGMKSVVQNLQTQDFIRVRVGIGQPEHKGDLINYVTNQIPKDEKEILQKGVDKAAEAVLSIIENGIDIAMNTFNGKEN